MRRNIFKLIKLDNKPSFKLSKENNVFDLLKFCQFQENSEENEFTRAFPTYGIEFYIDKADITFELNISDILRLVKENFIGDGADDTINLNVYFNADNSNFNKILFLKGTYEDEVIVRQMIFKNCKLDDIIATERCRNISFERCAGGVFSLNIMLSTGIKFFYSVFENVLFNTSVSNSRISLVMYMVKITGALSFDLNIITSFDVKFLDIKDAVKTELGKLRQLKKKFSDVGNDYDALSANICEQKIIQHSLEKSSRLLENLPDRFLIFLNNISNEFGVNWIRGVKFTLFLNLIGTAIIFISLKSRYHTTDILWEIFFSNLAPIYKIDRYIELRASFTTFFFQFFFKIFIIYGYYQTIQAFRKHRLRT